MNSKINLNEISDFLSNLRKDKTILSESTIVIESVLQKPYPESDLHSLSFEELSAKLNEARREQHRIPQFSAQEIAHLKFVDEAMSILEYVQSAGNTFVSSIQKSKEAHDKGDAESAQAHFKTAKKSRYHMNDKDLDQATPHFKVYKELQKKYDDKPNVAESEKLEELSNETLGRYKSAAGKAASAADSAGDFKTGNKRFSGIMKATKKQFANDAKAVKKESVDLDEANVESKIASLEKKIQDARDAIGLAREKRKMKGQRQQGPREMALQKKIDDLRHQIDDIERSTKNESDELDEAQLDEFIEFKNKALHAVMHKQKQSNLASGVEHLAKKNTAMTAHHAAKKAGNHEEAAKHLETANVHHATAMKHHDAVQELSKKMAALHTN